MNVDINDVSSIVVIAGKNQKDLLAAAISENGGRLLNLVYGRGAVKASYLMDAFGLVAEENKVIMICLLPKKKVDGMINMLEDKFNFDKPNTGIAFTLALNELSF